MITFGVYISGPGITGELIVRDAPNAPCVYDSYSLADWVRDDLQRERPSHRFRVRPYDLGDEDRGFYSPGAGGAA